LHAPNYDYNSKEFDRTHKCGNGSSTVIIISSNSSFELPLAHESMKIRKLQPSDTHTNHSWASVMFVKSREMTEF
jgi:hypothetical protein